MDVSKIALILLLNNLVKIALNEIYGEMFLLYYHPKIAIIVVHRTPEHLLCIVIRNPVLFLERCPALTRPLSIYAILAALFCGYSEPFCGVDYLLPIHILSPYRVYRFIDSPVGCL